MWVNGVIPVCAYNVGVGSSDLDWGFVQQGDSSAKGSSVRNAHQLFLVLTLVAEERFDRPIGFEPLVFGVWWNGLPIASLDPYDYFCCVWFPWLFVGNW